MTTRRSLHTSRWQKLRRQILERDGNRCRYCGGPADTVDHVLAPGAGGGELDVSNLVAACSACNRRKGNRPASSLARTERGRSVYSSGPADARWRLHPAAAVIAICGYCGRLMDGSGCVDNRALPRGEEPGHPKAVTWACHDCGVQPGGLHHPGCVNGVCRQCGDQLLFCQDDYRPAPTH